MQDVTFHLAPVTAQEALEQCFEHEVATPFSKELVGRVCLTSMRSPMPFSASQQFVTDFPQIQEMDINPLIVGEVGTDPVVADARHPVRKRADARLIRFANARSRTYHEEI